MRNNGDNRKKSYTVHDLPVEERPRERLIKQGSENLPLNELLAVVLGRGIAGESVMMTVQRLLSHFGNLEGMANASVEELQVVKGIGPAKACQIKASFELGRRNRNGKRTFHQKTEVNNPEDVDKIIKSQLLDTKKEHFWAILLDTCGRMIRTDLISVGSLDSSIVHPREAFKQAISASAAKIIFVHNHPSGSTQASEDDIAVTKRLVETGGIIGIDVLDHVIVGEEKPYSLKRNGQL